MAGTGFVPGLSQMGRSNPRVGDGGGRSQELQSHSNTRSSSWPMSVMGYHCRYISYPGVHGPLCDLALMAHSHVLSYPIAHLPSVPPGHDFARGHARISLLKLELRQYPGARFSDSSVPSAVGLSVLGKVGSQSRALFGFIMVQPSHSRSH